MPNFQYQKSENLNTHDELIMNVVGNLLEQIKHDMMLSDLPETSFYRLTANQKYELIESNIKSSVMNQLHAHTDYEAAEFLKGKV